MNRALWIVQILLAALFLLAGSMKFIIPGDQMAKQMPSYLSIAFVHFIGACEILGAFGLILPRLLNIKPVLTPVAASGLLIIMVGATAISFQPAPAKAIFPGVTALLCAFVAWGRGKA